MRRIFAAAVMLLMCAAGGGAAERYVLPKGLPFALFSRVMDEGPRQDLRLRYGRVIFYPGLKSGTSFKGDGPYFIIVDRRDALKEVGMIVKRRGGMNEYARMRDRINAYENSLPTSAGGGDLVGAFFGGKPRAWEEITFTEGGMDDGRWGSHWHIDDRGIIEDWHLTLDRESGDISISRSFEQAARGTYRGWMLDGASPEDAILWFYDAPIASVWDDDARRTRVVESSVGWDREVELVGAGQLITFRRGGTVAQYVVRDDGTEFGRRALFWRWRSTDYVSPVPGIRIGTPKEVVEDLVGTPDGGALSRYLDRLSSRGSLAFLNGPQDLRRCAIGPVAGDSAGYIGYNDGRVCEFFAAGGIGAMGRELSASDIRRADELFYKDR